MQGYEYNQYQIEAFDVSPAPYSEEHLSEEQKKYIELATQVLRKQMILSMATCEDYGDDEEVNIREWDRQLIYLLNGGCR